MAMGLEVDLAAGFCFWSVFMKVHTDGDCGFLSEVNQKVTEARAGGENPVDRVSSNKFALRQVHAKFPFARQEHREHYIT